MTQFHAYVSRHGSLIVKKYLGAHAWQQTRNMVRQEIGVFPATDIEQARKLALQLKG